MAVYYKDSTAGSLAQLLGALGGTAGGMIAKRRGQQEEEDILGELGMPKKLAGKKPGFQSMVAGLKKAQAIEQNKQQKQEGSINNDVDLLNEIEDNLDIIEQKSPFKKFFEKKKTGVTGTKPLEEAATDKALKALYASSALKGREIPQALTADGVENVRHSMDLAKKALSLRPETEQRQPQRGNNQELQGQPQAEPQQGQPPQDQEQPQENSFLQDLLVKKPALAAKGLAAGAAGAPGDMLSILENVRRRTSQFDESSPGYEGGEEQPGGEFYASPEQLEKMSPGDREHREAVLKEEMDRRRTGKPIIPTSEVIDKGITSTLEPLLGKGSLTPESDLDKVISRASREIGSGYALGLKAKTAVWSAISGNLGEEGMKLLGGSKLSQAIAHMSFGLLPALINAKGGIQQDKKRLYGEVEGAIEKDPQWVPVDKVSDLIVKGRAAASKSSTASGKIIEEQLLNLQKQIGGGKMQMNDIWDRKKEFNDIIWNELKPEGKSMQKAVSTLEEVKGALTETMHDWMPHLYPMQYPAFKVAEEIHAGLQASQSSIGALASMFKGGKVGGFTPQSAIMRSIVRMGDKFKLPIGGLIAGYPLGMSFIGGGAGLVGQDMYQYMKFLYKVPGAKKMVGKLIVDSLARRPAAMANDLKGIDRMAKTYEKKEARSSRRVRR